MKWPIALLALATAAPGFACLPYPGDNEPTRAERVREAAAGAPDIVYAVVDREMRAPSALGGELRRLRILHVYKGGMRAGQHIVMHISNATSMCDPRPPASMIATRGAYGVLLLYPHDAPIPFPDFLDPMEVEDLIRAGIIQSARGTPR
jgi:hypothetical protein